MRNQPYSPWQLIDSTADQREEAWDLDRRVELRTWMVGLLVLLPLVIISGRLFYLKQSCQAGYLVNAHPTSTKSESVPAMDGRIYSSDGQLLAYDHQQFALSIHYRWLESPPQARWWRQQALARLNRRQWGNASELERAKQEVLAEQARLWQRLSEISGMSVADLLGRRDGIQQRVERIATSVRSRQAERDNTEHPPLDQEPLPATGWRRLWQLVVRELTQPPEREARDPIVIREELAYHELIDDISVGIVAEVESHPRDFPGVQITTKTRRVYPREDFAAHVVGNRATLREEQLQEWKQSLNGADPLSLQSGDRRGRFGVERSYDITLRGLPGARRLTLNRRGEIVRSVPERQARAGQHLVLALHAELQETAEKLLDGLIPGKPLLLPPLPRGTPVPEGSPPESGCLLVMNIYSGELLVAASAPRPHLGRMNAGDSEYWQALNSDPRSPLLSRITQVTLAPGSTFKPMTAIALCQETTLPPGRIECRGFLDTPESHRCAIFRSTGHGHGDISLVDALARSCNVYFFTAARTVGPEALVRWCGELGFGKPTGVDLPFEQSGHVPDPADNSPSSSYHWYPGDNLGLAIGQSYLTVTPLQMLVLTAAIANQGELVTPRIVSRILPGDDEPAESQPHPTLRAQAPSRRLPVSPETWQLIREGMRRTVADPMGTAYQTVRSPLVEIAGKTGTAQTGLDRPSHAWFIGYAPAESPRYAFVVSLAHGGAGGEQAGPLARRIVERMLELELIDPR